jgi:hypothetical protein
MYLTLDNVCDGRMTGTLEVNPHGLVVLRNALVGSDWETSDLNATFST